jgi:hypothetical protein
MALRLRPGETAVRRDDHHLQIGIDPPRRVIVADTPTARRAAYELEHGRGLGHDDLRDPDVAALVRALDAADLLATSPGPLPARVLGPPDLARELHALETFDEQDPVVTVLLSNGPVRRDLLDGFVRDGTPHLIVAGGPMGWSVGPFVIPGVTACLRCADAAHGPSDPRRGLVIEQYARGTQGDGDRVGRALALAYAVREVRTLAAGARPTTWGAEVGMDGAAALVPRPIRRHPECGCAWGIALAG